MEYWQQDFVSECAHYVIFITEFIKTEIWPQRPQKQPLDLFQLLKLRKIYREN